MGDSAAKVLLSNGVRAFVRSGGTLCYKLVQSEPNLLWALYGVDPQGRVLEVLLIRNGETKIFRSADAIVNYHLSMCPNAREVFIPLPRTRDKNPVSD